MSTVCGMAALQQHPPLPSAPTDRPSDCVGPPSSFSSSTPTTSTHSSNLIPETSGPDKPCERGVPSRPVCFSLSLSVCLSASELKLQNLVNAEAQPWGGSSRSYRQITVFPLPAREQRRNTIWRKPRRIDMRLFLLLRCFCWLSSTTGTLH